MKLSSLLPLAWSLLTAASPLQPPTDDISPRANYDGYHVYSITPSFAREAQDLAKRFERHHTQPVRDTLSVAIPPEEVEEFHSLNLKARLVKDDLGAYIRSTDGEASPLRKRGGGGDGELPDLNWFDSYHAYEDHLRFWDGLVEAFEGNVRKFEIGRSWENRTIWAFRLFGDEKEGSEGKKKGGKKGGKGEGEGESEKPVILWHATVHAREWISTMVIEYLAYQLIDGYKAGDINATAFLDHYDFYLIPFHNPDGFVYTQTTDRLWRKNRQPRPTLNTTCLGTDGNRNWVFEWDAEPPEGGSTPDPCGQTYRGISPGDTPENAAVDSLSAALASRSGPGIRSFIDFHSYSQLILTPWGFSCDPLPETLPRMVEVANGTARAIEAASERGSEYLAGPGCEILYFSTGNSRDHHYAVRGAEHSWTLELSPSAEEEQVGFVLPPGEIWPVVREQWAGQIWLLNEVWEG